jgi:outer membrane protein
MNRKILILCAIIASSASFADTTSDRFNIKRLGFCDGQFMLHQSKASVEFFEHRNKRMEESQKLAAKTQEDLRKEHQQLEAKRALGPDAYANAQKKLQTKAQSFEKKAQDWEKKLQEVSTKAFERISTESKKILGELKVKYSLDDILDKNASLLIDEKKDLTDEAIKILNTRLPTLKLTIPPMKV